MAQRGKRKASAAPATTSRTPRKKINLNGATPTRSRPTRARKSIEGEFKPEEGVIDPVRGSLPKQQARSSSGASNGSNFSLASARSRFSNSFRSFTPTLESWGKAVQSANLSDWLRDRLARQDQKTRQKMASSRKIDIKGKGKAIEEDEENHLSADESARMIELLDKPVSMQPWLMVNGHKEESYEDSDAQSGHSVEHLLFGHDREATRATLSDVDDSEELDEKVKSLQDNVEEIKLADSEARESLEDESMSVPETRKDKIDKASASDESAIVVNEESLDIAEAKGRPTIDQSLPFTKGRVSCDREDESKVNGQYEDSSQATHEDDDTDSIQVNKSSKGPNGFTAHLPDAKGKADSKTETAPELSSQDIIRDSQADNDDRTSRDEKADEEEESFVRSEGAARDIIDLTESTSPEEEKDRCIPLQSNPQNLSTPEIARRPSSGLFSNGIMAMERQASEIYSATRVIQQLGSRQMSASSSYMKSLNKPSTGFRKKEPIFNRTRKSLAKDIANNKMEEMLNTLRRRARMVLKAPYLDDMLKKKVALNKVLGDTTPEEEVQIRHLRAILARSSASLRPARRHLKEQERLALEAKLLQKRALGIMGRQPLPRSLTGDREELVRQTYRKEGKIAQVVGAAVQNRDIIKLKPGVWLNDEVINFYMKLILKRSDEAITKRANARAAKKRIALNEYTQPEDKIADQALVKELNKIWNGIWNCWTCTSFFYTKLETKGYSGVRQWTRKVDLFTKDVILLPINISSTHWVCACINMRKCRFEYYDSMRSRPRGVFEQLKRYLLSEYEDKRKGSAGPLLLDGWDCYVSQQSPLQENAFDCGVFACQTLEQLSRRSPRDFELKDDLNVEKVVQRSRELSEAKGRREESNDESDEGEISITAEEEEEEEWNFSQINIPYLRQRMVYEIANTALLNE